MPTVQPSHHAAGTSHVIVEAKNDGGGALHPIDNNHTDATYENVLDQGHSRIALMGENMEIVLTKQNTFASRHGHTTDNQSQQASTSSKMNSR